MAAEVPAPGGLVASFCSRRDRMAIVGLSRDVQELRAGLTQHGTGILLGPWQEIPEHIPRALGATITWALNTLR